MTSELAIVRRDWNVPIREDRSSLENPQTPLSYPAEWLLDIFNGGRTDSGIRVSELTAFQASYFLACVDLIAGAVAALPWHVYERTIVGNGRAAHAIAYDHPLYDLINLSPNDEMSQFVLTKAFMCHVLAWSNGYIEIQRDAGNGVAAFWPRNPAKTRPHRLSAPMRLEASPWRPFPVNLAAGTLVYRTTDGIDSMDESENDAERPGSGRFIPLDDMLHIPGLTFDGRIGQSVVWLARQTIGLALATEKFGAKYFANFAKPGGLLIAPSLSPEQREQAKRSWMEAQGGENAHRVAVMPPGFDWKPMSNNPQEAQTAETEDRLRNKICAVFHVPPRMVGDTERSGKSSAEQDGQEFLQYTLAQWLQAIRVEWKRKLFPHRGIGRTPRNRYYIDCDLMDLRLPDMESRGKYFGLGKQWGFLNTNDINAIEKRNPIDEPWAEKYWMPINMTLVDTPVDPTHQDGAGNGEVPNREDKSASERYFRHFSGVFRDGFGRLLERKNRDAKAVTSTIGAALYSIRDAWFDLACMELRFRAAAGAETEKFIADYVGGMAKRAEAWTADSADAELRRAIGALKVAAYREAASLKAKEGEQE
jgi:HK97 family phage portal protein